MEEDGGNITWERPPGTLEEIDLSDNYLDFTEAVVTEEPHGSLRLEVFQANQTPSVSVDEILGMYVKKKIQKTPPLPHKIPSIINSIIFFSGFQIFN